MSHMQRKRRLGHIIVHSETFCQDCKPYPQTVVTHVKVALPVIAYKRNEDLLSIIKVDDVMVRYTLKSHHD